MKQKLTLLLIALFTTMGAWAATHYVVTGRTQVTDLANLSSSKYYILQNNGSGGYIKYDGSQLIMSTKFDYASVVQLDYDNTNVTIKQVSTGTYYQLFTDQARVTLGASSANFTFNTDGCASGLYRIANGSIYMNRDDGDTYPKGHSGTGNYSKWKIYEVTIVEIADDACYTIDFISHDGTKTWGLKSGTTEQTAVEDGTGDVYVAHSYTNLSGEKRWIFVNNSDGTFLAYHGQATEGFNYFHPISEFKIEGMWAGMSDYTAAGDNYSGKVCITNDKRYINKTDLGTYILKESTGDYDNSSAPYFNANTNNYFTSALVFTATEDEVSTAASNAISKFDDSYGPSYLFTTTDGAFFKNLTDNQSAGATTYCNLWISKNTKGKPQVKLISSSVGSDGKSGNNMRSTGGLYTTGSSFTYNLSISEGKIVSYTIIGTAVGALSITPAGGSAEAFAASASVNKTVVLASSAKQTSFTLSGSNRWLDVTGFVVQYESDATPVSSLSDITSDGIYTITCYTAERGGMYAGTTYIDACGGHANTNYPANKSTALDASDVNQQFVIYTHGDNKYLYNIGRNKFVGVADGLYYKMTGAPINTWSVSNGAYDGYFHLTSQADSKMATMNAWVATGSNDSKDYAITGQDANEDANNFALLRVGTLTSGQTTAIETIFTNYETLQSSLTTLGNYTIGSALGEYNHASFATNDAKETAITNIQNGLKACAASDIPTANTSVQEFVTAMNINLPTGKFIRLKGGDSSKYPYYGEKVDSRYPMTSDGTLPTTIFYNDGTHLLSYSSGIYWGVTGGDGKTNWDWTAVGGTGSTITFAKSNVIGKYFVELTSVDVNYPYVLLYDHGTSNGRCDRSKYSSISSITDNHMNWTLEEVTSLPVTITSVGLATLYSPVALTIPTDVTAYVVTSDEETCLRLAPISDGIIPANTGVILEASTGTYNFDIATGGSAESELTGTVATISRPEGSYVLSGGESGLGFYAKGSTGSTTIPGFKAYYQPEGEDVKGFVGFFFDNNPDAINDVIGKVIDGRSEIFNLAGQRMNKMQKGINIVNGKKILK